MSRAVLVAVCVAALAVTGCSGGAPTAAEVAPSGGRTVSSAPPTAAPTSRSTPTPTPPATVSAAPVGAREPVIRRLSAAEWSRMGATGTWRPGCPVGREGLRRLEVDHVGFDGRTHRGALVVNRDVAASLARVFVRLHEARFPIRRMQPIEAYAGDDDASMRADNTSAFNCRTQAQANAPAAASPHANGRAVDLNPYENPWVDPRCGCFRPAATWGRQRVGKGVVTGDGVVRTAFEREGWIWRGTGRAPDFQHFDTGYPSRPPGGSVKPTPAAAFPVPVTVGDARQLVTVRASGSRASVRLWERRGGTWRAVAGPYDGRVGSAGVVPGSTRRQGTNTTPAGTYRMTEAFGLKPDPGTLLPYRRVGPDDWWVQDNRSAYYNTYRRGAQGGFDTRLPESDVNGSERLARHTTTYRYAVVIDYNRKPAVRYRGAGIFLHVSGSGATAGCVSVSRAQMVSILRWLDPAARPRIAIG